MASNDLTYNNLYAPSVPFSVGSTEAGQVQLTNVPNGGLTLLQPANGGTAATSCPTTGSVSSVACYELSLGVNPPQPGAIWYVSVAAAPDFTEELMWAAMMPHEREQLLRDGVLPVPSEYGDPYPVTAALIEDGRRHLLLQAPIPLRCPVRLLHGQADAAVPWETSMRLANRLEGSDVHVTLVKDSEHRLSRPADLELLRHALGTLLLQDAA